MRETTETPTLDLDTIATLERLEQQATTGPWTATNVAASPDSAWGVVSEEWGVIEHDFVNKSDAEFIAAFRNAARAVLARIRGLNELCQEMQRIVDAMSAGERENLLPDWFAPRLDALTWMAEDVKLSRLGIEEEHRDD